MNNASLLLTSFVVNAAWQVAILAFAAWGLSRLVKRAGPELQHKIWVVTLILATLAPATPVIESLLVRHALTGQASVDVPALARVTVHQIALTRSGIIFQPDLLYVVSGLYLAAVLFCFLRLCWMVYRTAALVRNG